QAAGRRMGLPRRTLGDEPRRGQADEPRLRDGTSELRDVIELHESGDGADRAVRADGEVREEGVRAAEVVGREGGEAASRKARGEADRVESGAGFLYRREGGGAVQAGSLSVLVRVDWRGVGRDRGQAPIRKASR